MRSFFFLTLMITVVFTEIYLFIKVSAYLHILIIFALTVGTAMIGLSLAKTQSISAFSDLKHIGSADSNFFIYMIDGIGALGAGLLLLLPGFGTDKYTGRLFQTFFFTTEDTSYKNYKKSYVG